MNEREEIVAEIVEEVLEDDEIRQLMRKLEQDIRDDERQRCAEIAKAWDTDHPDTNYGACISRLILGEE